MPDCIPWARLFGVGAVVQGAASVMEAFRHETVSALGFAFASGLLTCAFIERVTRAAGR